MPLQDVKVTIDISKPSSLIGFGVPVILVEDETATEPTYKEYFDIFQVQEDFDLNHVATNYASKVFAQGNNSPNKVAIATYNNSATTPFSATHTLERFFANDFYFVLLAAATVEEHLAVSDYIEAQSLKMAVVTTDSLEDVDKFDAKKYDRTIVFYHDKPEELPEAALVGAIGSRPVGSVTWKFKTLAGVTPQDVNAGQLEAIHRKGAIVYVVKAGINQTSEGVVASGEYIDVIHGKDWIRLNIEQQVQNLLSTSDKVPYTDAGIAQIESVVTNVLTIGIRNGIIAVDGEGAALASITALSRSEMSESARASRQYNGLSFTFQLAGAIHEAEIKGEVLV